MALQRFFRQGRIAAGIDRTKKNDLAVCVIPTITFGMLQDYQRHRLGYAKGAKGEVGAALRQVEAEPKQHPAQHAPLPEGISEGAAESLMSPFVSFDSDSPFARDEQLLAQIARWRMEYQNFRVRSHCINRTWSSIRLNVTLLLNCGPAKQKLYESVCAAGRF